MTWKYVLEKRKESLGLTNQTVCAVAAKLPRIFSERY